MRTIIATLAVMLAVSAANATPLKLTCTGAYTYHLGESNESTVRGSTLVTIDFDYRTVSLANELGGWTTPIISPPNDDIITAAAKDAKMSGKINRITGEAYFGFLVVVPTELFVWFEGTCRPGQRLF
jgi:hypothetical protein